MILHLGVIDVPYSDSSYRATRKKDRRIGDAKRGKANAPHNHDPEVQTTAEVAAILEDHYHVMEIFVQEVGAEQIANAFAHSMAGAIENIAAGAPIGRISLTAEAEGEIVDAFHHFLSQQEMDGIQPGVPTHAALMGVSHRFLHPYAKRAPRPSFIDTGLYEANFICWTDE